MLFFLDTLSLKQYNINVNKIRKLVNNMKQYQVYVFNWNTGEKIDTFIERFPSVDELKKFMDTELHTYDEQYSNLHYIFADA